MTAATRTTTTANPTLTMLNITTALKTAFAAITSNTDYATPIADYLDSSLTFRMLVYRIILGTGTKATIYQQIKVTNGFVISQKFSNDYNVSTKSSTNNSPDSTAVTFSSSVALSLTAYDHPEIKGVIIEQSGSTSISLCYCYPSSKPSWWNEDSYTYAFIPKDASWNSYWGLTGANSPYNHAATDAYGINALSSLSLANPITNRRDVLPGAVLLSPGSTNQGVAARFSADIVQVAANGLARFDILQVAAGSEEYQLLQSGAAGALALRVT